MRWFRGMDQDEAFMARLEEVRVKKFEEYRELCTAFAYLQNRITAIERRIDMHTNDPQPSLYIGIDKWLVFGQSPYPMEDIY